MLLWLASCVVAVDQTVIIDQPVDRIVVDVSNGDVRIRARDAAGIQLSGTFGGAGHGPIRHEVTDGVLVIRYDCQLCGGEVEIEAPPEVTLDLSLGAGSLTVEEMAGNTDARIEVGSAEVSYVVAPEHVDLDLGTGAIEIEVPHGAYALDLRTGRGDIDIDGVIDDPDSPNLLFARTKNGSIEISGED